MIKKLRTKFIVLSMVAVFVLLTIVVAGMNIINYRAVVEEGKQTLAVLAMNQGAFPDMDLFPENGSEEFPENPMPENGSEEFPQNPMPENGYEEFPDNPTPENGFEVPPENEPDFYISEDGIPANSEGNANSANQYGKQNNGNQGANKGENQNANQGNGTGEGTGKNAENIKPFLKNMSPETPFETRFFSVLMNENGVVVESDLHAITSVTNDQAIDYAMAALNSGKKNDFRGDYLYEVVTESDGVRIIFLDCGRKLASFRTFLWISLAVAAVGYVIFFFVIFFCSKRIIRPVAESYEKQKRFITDAGHEIKTPLTIIQADAEVLSMEHEDNEWVDDIKLQASRLSELTHDLISLARMEESPAALVKVEFPISDVVTEEADVFRTMAHTQHKRIELRVEQGLSYDGDEKAIRRLINILLDNALKYSPEEGEVVLALKKSGRQIRLSIENETMAEISEEQLQLLFDRFYRLDSSRSAQTGGHGIGLSMAKAIAEAHGGKISAKMETAHRLKMEVILP